MQLLEISRLLFASLQNDNWVLNFFARVGGSRFCHLSLKKKIQKFNKSVQQIFSQVTAMLAGLSSDFEYCSLILTILFNKSLVKMVQFEELMQPS